MATGYTGRRPIVEDKRCNACHQELGTFTEELTDIFALQEKVARAVVAKLTRRTTTAPVAVLTTNPEAYDAFLRGRALLTRGSREEAIKLFEQAVALDPVFALAWASLAEAKFARYSHGGNRTSEQAAEARLLRKGAPHGFGRAIAYGLQQMNGDAAVIMMADESDDCRDVVRYWDKLNEGYDCVFGSRFLPGGGPQDRPPL